MANYRLYPSTSGPSAATSYSGSYCAGINFRTTATTWLTGYWWWVCGSGAQPTGATKCALWQVTSLNAGVLIPAATVTSGTLTAGQWNYIALTTPVALSPGVDYIAAIAVNGNFPLTNSYFGSGGTAANGIVNGPLVAPADFGANTTGWIKSGWSAGQALYTTTASDPATQMPQSVDASFNSWVDVQVTDTDPNITSTYRFWPTCTAALGNGVDANTGGDALANFVLSHEIQLTNPIAIHKIWWFSNNGTLNTGNTSATTQLPTAVDVWSVNSGGVTGVNVYHNGSPSWSGAAGSGWISTTLATPLILFPTSAYKVSAYNNASTPVSWSVYRYSSWKAPSLTGPPVAAYPNGLTVGGATIPKNDSASTAYTYDPGITHPNTEPATAAFLIGPANADAGDNYPNLVVGVHSSSPGPVFESFWIDIEFQPTVQASGSQGITFNGTGNASIGGPPVSGAGSITFAGTANVTWTPPPFSSGTGTIVFNGTGVATVTGFPVTGAAQLTFSGVGYADPPGAFIPSYAALKIQGPSWQTFLDCLTYMAVRGFHTNTFTPINNIRNSSQQSQTMRSSGLDSRFLECASAIATGFPL